MPDPMAFMATVPRSNLLHGTVTGVTHIHVSRLIHGDTLWLYIARADGDHGASASRDFLNRTAALVGNVYIALPVYRYTGRRGVP